MDAQGDPHREHEARLAAALRDLVRQIDISDYRDSKGHTATHNLAFIKAQALSDEFCVTHDDICQALDLHGDDDLAAASSWLAARRHDDAGHTPAPPQFQSWTAGP